MRKVAVVFAGSNCKGSSDCCSPSSAIRIGVASCSARGVGTIPFGLRTNNSSFNMWRRRGKPGVLAGALGAQPLARPVYEPAPTFVDEHHQPVASHAPHFLAGLVC